MAHLFAGLVLIIAGIAGIAAWWNMFGLVMRGVVPFMLLVTGLVALLSAARRSSQRERVQPAEGQAFEYATGYDDQRSRQRRTRAASHREVGQRDNGRSNGTPADLVSG